MRSHSTDTCLSVSASPRGLLQAPSHPPSPPCHPQKCSPHPAWTSSTGLGGNHVCRQGDQPRPLCWPTTGPRRGHGGTPEPKTKGKRQNEKPRGAPGSPASPTEPHRANGPPAPPLDGAPRPPAMVRVAGAAHDARGRPAGRPHSRGRRPWRGATRLGPWPPRRLRLPPPPPPPTPTPAPAALPGARVAGCRP